MPIAGYKPTGPTSTKPSEPVETKPFETTVVDTTEKPIRGLLPFVSGSRWTVDWWHQYLDADDTLTGFDPDLPEALQQYVWIEDLVLHVNSPIESEQDQNGLTVSLKGNAIYVNEIPPYVGDLFAAPVLDNRIALFRVTEVQRKSYSKRTVFEINYTSIAFVTDKNDLRLKNLGDKTIRKYVYDENGYLGENGPLYTEQEYAKKVNLRERFIRLSEYYVNNLLDEDTGLFLVPGQDHRVFDHMVQEFVLKVIPTEASSLLSKVVRIGPNVRASNTGTLWDLLIERTDFLLPTISREAGAISTGLTGVRSVTRSLCYMGVEYTMLPLDAPMLNDGSARLQANIEIKRPTLDNYVQPQQQNQNLFPDMFTYDTYVLSPGFYDNSNSGLSTLETSLLKYLRSESLELSDISDMSEAVIALDPVSQYYFIPLIALLIRSQYEEVASVY